MLWHGVGGVLLLMAIVAMTVWRGLQRFSWRRDYGRQVQWLYLVAGVLMFALLGLHGTLGAQLAAEFGVHVSADGEHVCTGKFRVVGGHPPGHAHQAGPVHGQKIKGAADKRQNKVQFAQTFVIHPAGKFGEPVVDGGEDTNSPRMIMASNPPINKNNRATAIY
jgi:hypothetical protein